MPDLKALFRDKSLIRRMLLIVVLLCVCPMVAQVFPSPMAIAFAAEFTATLDLFAIAMLVAAATRFRGALRYAVAGARVQARRTRVVVRRCGRAIRRRVLTRRLRVLGGSKDDEPGGAWAWAALPA